MKRIFTLFFCAASLLSISAPFTPGNIIVVRVGTGSAALTAASTAVFLDEYSTSGTLVQSIALPTADNGTNQTLTTTGTSTAEGFISLSANRQFVVVTGYDASPGTGLVAGTTSASIPRVVGIIDASGNINTTTALTDAFSTNNIRSAATVDGTAVWMSGSSGGVRYATTGATTSSVISGTPANTRVVNIFNSQLYISSSTTNFYGIGSVGTGTPTSTGQTSTLLPGFPTATGPSTYAYDFKPTTGDIVYVADDRISSSGGVQKWILTNGTWALAYTINPATNIGVRGVVVNWATNPVTIYATGTNNTLYQMTDNGASTSSISTAIVSAGTNTAFRGITFTPNTIILPLQLLSFSASPKENTVAFSWKTANERNTHHFDIEQSFDGTNFKSVATVAASGNTTAEKSYSYTGNLNTVITYYRLKMVDADGKSTTSSVVKVAPSKTGFSLGNVYPIPAKNNVTVEWNSNRAGATTLVLTNMSGRTVRTLSLQSTQGFNQYQLDVNTLTSGQYFLRLKNDVNQVQTIITKQ